MPRLVKKEAHDPIQVGDKHICMCGLSKNQPFCDGSHVKTIDEDEKKLYWYNEDHTREEITTDKDECCGGCEECHCQDSSTK